VVVVAVAAVNAFSPVESGVAAPREWFFSNVEKHGDNDEKEICNVVDKPKHGLYTVYMVFIWPPCSKSVRWQRHRMTVIFIRGGY
jgi:hypothetical protein